MRWKGRRIASRHYLCIAQIASACLASGSWVAVNNVRSDESERLLRGEPNFDMFSEKKDPPQKTGTVLYAP